MAWGAEEDDEDVYGGVAQALADPASTYSDETGAAPEQEPQIQDGSPSTQQAQKQDTSKDADEEANYIAGNGQPSQDQNELEALDQGGLPREGTSTPPQEAMTTTDEPGDAGDADTAALAGGAQTYQAPKPLVYQPYADHSADEQALVTQKAGENPDNFKPSLGRKLAGALAGGLVGFGTRNSGEGMNAARAVTGKPLAQAQQRWKAQEAPLEQKIQADKAADQAVDRTNAQATNQYNAQERNMTNQARVDNWNAQAQQRKAMAQAKLNTVDKNTLGPVDPNNPFGEWQGKTPGGQVVRGLEPPAAVQKSPQFIMKQRQNDIAQMQQAGIKLTQREITHYMAGDKTLGDSTTRTDIHVNEKPDGSWAPPGGGRAPGTMTPSKQDQIIHQKNTAMTKAQEQHAAGLMTDDEYQSALQDAQDDFEQRIAQETGQQPEHVTVGKDFQFQPGSKPAANAPAQAAAPAQQAPPPQQAPAQPNAAASIVPPKATTPPPKNATGRVKGSDGYWYWIAGNKVIGRS